MALLLECCYAIFRVYMIDVFFFLCRGTLVVTKCEEADCGEMDIGCDEMRINCEAEGNS
jgi:hypothetical protein